MPLIWGKSKKTKVLEVERLNDGRTRKVDKTKKK